MTAWRFRPGILIRELVESTSVRDYVPPTDRAALFARAAEVNRWKEHLAGLRMAHTVAGLRDGMAIAGLAILDPENMTPDLAAREIGIASE
jgi:hypothetical protein